MLVVNYESIETMTRVTFDGGVERRSRFQGRSVHTILVKGGNPPMREESIGDAIARRADDDLHASYFTRTLADLSSWLSSREGIPNFESKVSMLLSQRHLDASRRLGFRAREIRFRFDDRGRPEVSVDPFIPPSARTQTT